MSMLVHRSLCAVAIGAIIAASPAWATDQAPAKSRQCEKAARKVAKEEQWEAKGQATIEHDRKERATCATRAICERYDSRIEEMEKRKARHDARLAKFRTEAAKACGTS